MLKNLSLNKNKGFTIIEVVLVLAIAGLIFLMVFLALPALQRSQKDTQRRDQLSMLVTQITQYQANNRNRLPSGTGVVLGSTDGASKVTGSADGWVTFYKNYLLAQNDVFEDPNGNPYNLQIEDCGTGQTNTDTGETECDTQRYDWGFDSAGEGATEGDNKQSFLTGKGLLATASLDGLLAANENKGDYSGPTDYNQNYYILITIGSSCSGEVVVKNTGARKVSVAYKLEGGGTYCSNN